MAKKQEVPGNTLQSQHLFDLEVQTCGLALFKMGSVVERLSEEAITVKQLKFRVSPGDAGRCLAMVTADIDGKPMIAFISGADFRESFIALQVALAKGRIDWKQDQFSK